MKSKLIGILRCRRLLDRFISLVMLAFAGLQLIILVAMMVGELIWGPRGSLGWYGLAALSNLILASLAAWCFALARRGEY